MADFDWSGVEQELKDKLGDLYTPGALESVQANASYGSGDTVDPASVQNWTDRIAAKESLRADNEPNSTYTADGQGGYTTGPTGNVNTPTGASTPSVSASWLQPQQAPAVNPVTQQRSDELYKLLSDRANQSLTLDRNNPVIRAQADAYSAQQDRSARNYISDEAEREGPYANIEGTRRMVAEHAGQASGAFEAQLMGQELTARRAEIQHALDSMGGMLSDQEKLQLTQQLALIDDATRRAGLAVQSAGQNQANDLGLRQLGLSEWDKNAYWNYANTFGL